MLLRIVEDHPMMGRLLERGLEGSGWVAEVTSSDFESLLGPGPWEGVDAALVDLRLSAEISGVDVLAYLRDNRPGIRRLAMTGWVDEVAYATDAAEQVLVKPFLVPDLLRALR